MQVKPNKYALFSRSGVQMWLTHKFELYVKGVGWIAPPDLKVDDELTYWGKVTFIGTEVELRAYRARQAAC